MSFTIKQIDHVVLYVSDMDRAVAFYETVLGCRVVRHNTKLNLMHLSAGGSMIDLLPAPEGGAGGRNVDHVALQITPFEAEPLQAHLRAHGIEPTEPRDRFGAEGVGPSLTFEDPDGNTIELKGPNAGMITLYENLRTIVYAPFYVADQRGYWAGEGLDVAIQLSPDPVETAEGLLAGRADVSWGGPMRVMLHHDRDASCPLVAFGQVVARDPFVLIGREPNPGFRFQDLRSKRLAVATEVPTPWMTFQDDLSRAGVDPATLDIAAPAPMQSAARRLASGEIDVAQVLEPHAAAAIADGTAHVWHRFSDRGDIGYTSFYTTRAYLDANPETCRALLAGIRPALHAVNTEAPAALAGDLAPLFPNVERPILETALAGYQAAGLWSRDTDLLPSAFLRLKAALLSGGLISRDIPYDDVVARLETS